MNKIVKRTLLSILSVSLIILSTYWAWTIINNINQTATTWDIISSEWVNAVNTNLNSASATTGNLVSCFPTIFDGHDVIVCIWPDWTCRYLRTRKILNDIYTPNRISCWANTIY